MRINVDFTGAYQRETLFVDHETKETLFSLLEHDGGNGGWLTKISPDPLVYGHYNTYTSAAAAVFCHYFEMSGRDVTALMVAFKLPKSKFAFVEFDLHVDKGVAYNWKLEHGDGVLRFPNFKQAFQKVINLHQAESPGRLKMRSVFGY